MADSGGGIIDTYPSASRVLRSTEKGIGESGVAPIDPSNSEGVRSLEDGEGKARETSDVNFIGGKARGGANGVVIGVFDVGKVDIPVVLVFVTDHG